MRVNVNMDEALVKEIDKKAESLFVSRSAYMSMVLSRALAQDNVLQQMPSLIAELSRLNDAASCLGLTEKSSDIPEIENE